MTEPATYIDPRFSDPEAVATEWKKTEHVLDTAELFWLATVRADGRPHVTPLLAVWLDGAMHFATGATEQKAMNFRANQHVILTTGANEWDHGLDVVLEGDAVQVRDVAALERLAALWATKWDGRWHFEPFEDGFRHEAGEALVFSVRPRKILAFGKGEFSHTRHRFDLTEM